MRIRHVAALLATIALVAGCSSGSDDNIGPTDPTSGNGSATIPPPPAGVGSFKAVFVAGGGVWPYPTDLHFLGSTDGTLNISSSFAVFPQRAAMNQLDGWSTTASSYFRFSQPLKNDATMLNSSVRIIRVQTFRDPTTGVYAPTANVLGVLQPGVDYSVRVDPDLDTGGTYAEIQWLKPLAASSGMGLANGYIVLVTNGMLNNSGTAATPDTDYLNIRTEAITEIGRAIASGNPSTFVPTCPGITNPTLNSICKLTYAHLLIGSNPALGPAAVKPANVILSYHFTTQSPRDVLVNMSQTHTAKPISVIPTGFTSGNLLAAAGYPNNPACPNCTDAYVGTLQVPYYLTPPSAQDPTGPLTKTWTAASAPAAPGLDPNSRFITRFNLTPAKKADLKIPVLLFKPNGNSPSGGVKPTNGWPVVLFMHGLGGDRTNSLLIADTYASQGFVVIAIDQILHGITNKTSPLYAGPSNPSSDLIYGPGVRERTFDVDYVNNVTGASGPDGIIDQSGRHIVTLALSAPLVARDGMRQTGSDMITLVKSLGSLDLDGLAGGDIDLNQIHYGGISLGGIVGPACVCSEMKSYYLNVPGGPLPTILRTAPAFASGVNAALAAANPLLVPNTALYAQFFRELQAAIDAGDPVNYVRQLGMDRPVLFTKVIGDVVVPNATNDYIINAAGASKITQAGLNLVPAGAPRYVTFLSGSHGSLLDPTANLAVTQEMQTHALSLVVTGGAGIQVVDSSLLQQ